MRPRCYQYPKIIVQPGTLKLLMETSSIKPSEYNATNRTRIMKLLLLLIPFLILYYPVIMKLANQWVNDPDFSYGFLIPIISIYLVLEKRDIIKRTKISSSPSGIFVMLFSFIFFLVGHYGVSDTLARASIISMLLGMVLLNFGKQMAKQLLVPILWLTFMIPIPSFIMAPLTFGLQVISTKLSVVLLRLFQVPVFLAGNVIDLGAIQLQVVEACSGLRYLIPLMAICFLYLAIYRISLLKSSLFLIIFILFSVFLNSFRLLVTALLSINIGQESATGFFHSFTGWIIFMIGLLCIFIFQKLVKAEPRVMSIKNDSDSVNQSLMLSNFSVISSVMMLISFCLLSNYIQYSGRQYKIDHKLSQIPETIANWNSHHISIDREIFLKTGATNYTELVFSNNKDENITVYVAYYAPLNQDHLGHTPNICMPGAGWKILHQEKVRLDVFSSQKRLPVEVNRLIVEQAGKKMLIYYWFLSGKKTFASKNLLKLYQAYSAIKFTPTDCYQIILYAGLNSNETPKDGDAKLNIFVSAVLQRLME